MAKFLGVISNSAPSPSDQRVLEYTDLELLANYLTNETQNLYCEFMQKVKAINERELEIFENSNKFSQIYDTYLKLSGKAIEIDQDADNVARCLSNIERSITRMENIPNNFAGCKCTTNLERNLTLGMLVELSEDMNRIANKVELVQEHEDALPVKCACDLNTRLYPLLDLHLKILEQIEEKVNSLSDSLIEVDEMFDKVHKKLAGKCYHRVRHTYATDC